VQRLHLSRLKNLSRDIGMKVSMIEHEQIVAAIADGDVRRAQALQAAHVKAAHARLIDTEGEPS
jgi:DNA-binding GntR family transcriptional regulator